MSQPTKAKSLESLEGVTETQLIEGRQQRRTTIIVGAAVILGLLILIAGVIFLSKDATQTTNIRDIFIILMAFEMLVIGLALILLILQISSLINVLKNEIKPILESTQSTVNAVRGTTTFLGDNLVKPVIKFNGYLATIMSVVRLFKPKRK